MNPDITIIGGGPAGGAAALLLSRQGWRVALVEHGPRHRAKACGDCLSPRGVRLLEHAGLLDQVTAVSVGATRRLRLHLDDQRTLSAAIAGPAGPGLLVQRHRFDQLLIDRATEAGARIIQPATARLLRVEPRWAEVSVTSAGRRQVLRSRLVVGADGLRSSVARAAALAAAGGPGRYGFALEVRPPGACVDAIRPDTIEMFLVAGGYVGLVNQGCGLLHVAGLVDRRAAGGAGPLAVLRHLARSFDLAASAGLGGPDAVLGRVLGAGPMPCRARRVAGRRVALVGDAAGFVEPFTGEGMSWALESAAALAAVIGDAAARQAWSAAAARRYRRAWARRVGRRQRRCRLIVAALHRPRLSRAMFRLAARHRRLVGYLVDRTVTP